MQEPTPEDDKDEQTQISSAVSLLTRPGSNWKKIESVIKTDLNDDENIQNNIKTCRLEDALKADFKTWNDAWKGKDLVRI